MYSSVQPTCVVQCPPHTTFTVTFHAPHHAQANLSGAIVSSARFNKKTIIDGADFTDVIIRKDINDGLCKIAKGTNESTGVDTRESLNCF
jgi:hypothetical protein